MVYGREKQEMIGVCNTELSDACDEFIVAHKAFKDAQDRLKVCREFCAKKMKESGLGNKQFIRHDGFCIILKEGVVKEDSVSLKKDKDE